MTHRKTVTKAERELEPEDLWHDDQLKGHYEGTKATFISSARSHNSTTIVSFADIAERLRARGVVAKPVAAASASTLMPPPPSPRMPPLLSSSALTSPAASVAGSAAGSGVARLSSLTCFGAAMDTSAGAGAASSGVALTGKTLEAHNIGNPGSPPMSIGAPSVASSGRSMPKRLTPPLQRAASGSNLTDSESGLPEVMPAGLDGEAKLQWKLNQMSLYTALKGDKKWGR